MGYQKEISNVIYVQQNCGMICQNNSAIEITAYSSEGSKQN